MTENPVMWTPGSERVRATSMHRFMHKAGHDDYDSLYAWSIAETPAFWSALCDFCEVSFDTAPTTLLARPANIMDAGWFAGSRLNYARHLLRHTGDRAALVFFGENGAQRELSRDQLREQVAAVAAGLRAAGIR